MWRALLVAMAMVSVPLGGSRTTPGGGAPEGGARTAAGCTLDHVDVNASIDEANHTMNATARVALVTGGDTSSVLLRLNRAMNITNITEEGAGWLSFNRSIDTLVEVSLGRSVPASTALNLTLFYHGEVLLSPDGNASYWGYVGNEGSWMRTSDVFFPRDQNFSRVSSTLAITVPQGRTAVATGALLCVTGDAQNGTLTFVWESGPANGMALTVGTYNHTAASSGGHRLDIYFTPEHNASAPSFAAELHRIIAFYTGLMGTPGFLNLSVAEIHSNFSAWGQTEPSMVWLSARNFGGQLPYRIMAHELGHQWWGIDVEGTGGGEHWIQEGFAGYVEAMYENAHYGTWGYLEFCRQRYINEFVGNIAEGVLAGNNYDLAATKGPWILHMVRYLLGDAEFNSTLAQFYGNNIGGRVDHLDYFGLVESATGTNLSWFVHYWFYSVGHLDYAAEAAHALEGAGALSRVEVGLVDRGQPSAMPLDVGLHHLGARQLFSGKAWNGSGGSTTFLCETALPVDEVVLDPDNWLLDIDRSTVLCTDARLDFSVMGIAPGNGTPYADESFGLDVAVAGNGTLGPNNLTVRLLVDGSAAGNATVELAAQGEAISGFQLRLPAGVHNITGIVDPEGTYYEKNESNNRLSLALDVRARPPPPADLSIEALYVSPIDITGGEEALLKAQVLNLGAGWARNFTVDFCIDSVDTGHVGRSANLSLGPGGHGEASVNWSSLPGRHTVFAKADPDGTVDDGNRSNNELMGTLDINTRPIAVLDAAPREVEAGSWVEFRGNRSSDDVGIASYFFDYGDGDNSGWLADPASSHRYFAKGSYYARLRVRDGPGVDSEWSTPVLIRVRNLPPEAVLSVRPSAGNVMTAFNFTSLSTDTDGNLTRYLWSFGDGKVARAASAEHAYAARGVYCVTLTVWDDSDAQASASANVTVRNLPPAAMIRAERRTVFAGESVNFSAGASTDPDDPFDRLTFAWELEGRNATGVNVSQRFTRPGPARVVLRVSDGNDTSEASLTVEVRPRPNGPPANPDAWMGAVSILGLVIALVLAAIYLAIPVHKKRPGEEE